MSIITMMQADTKLRLLHTTVGYRQHGRCSWENGVKRHTTQSRSIGMIVRQPNENLVSCDLMPSSILRDFGFSKREGRGGPIRTCTKERRMLSRKI